MEGACAVRPTTRFGVVLLLALAPRASSPRAGPRPAATANWPSFRGPEASGIAEGVPTPTTWNVPEGKNLRWKTPIPGLGHSSPVVWGDRLWITSAVRDAGDAPLCPGLYGDIA